MTQLTGHVQIYHSNTAIVDSSLSAVLGIRSIDKQGNEYVYLKGVGSTAAGDWVSFDHNYATTRLVSGAVGPVAIAMAAINSTSSYGWYQTFGTNTIANTDTISANKALYIDGTTGRADDLGVTGDLIIGAYSMTADTANVATVFLTYPNVSASLGGSSSSFSDAITPSGTINGVNDTFTLPQAPSPAGSLILTKNGVVQKSSGNDYTLSTLTITFTSGAIPQTGDVLLAWFRY